MNFYLFPSVSPFILTGSPRPSFGVDGQPHYHYFAVFSYGAIKTRDLGWIVGVIRTILHLIETPVISEK